MSRMPTVALGLALSAVLSTPVLAWTPAGHGDVVERVKEAPALRKYMPYLIARGISWDDVRHHAIHADGYIPDDVHEVAEALAGGSWQAIESGKYLEWPLDDLHLGYILHLTADCAIPWHSPGRKITGDNDIMELEYEESAQLKFPSAAPGSSHGFYALAKFEDFCTWFTEDVEANAASVLRTSEINLTVFNQPVYGFGDKCLFRTAMEAMHLSIRALIEFFEFHNVVPLPQTAAQWGIFPADEQLVSPSVFRLTSTCVSAEAWLYVAENADVAPYVSLSTLRRVNASDATRQTLLEAGLTIPEGVSVYKVPWVMSPGMAMQVLVAPGTFAPSKTYRWCVMVREKYPSVNYCQFDYVHLSPVWEFTTPKVQVSSLPLAMGWAIAR